jgi:putative N6-adenine-specific DNA methylase
MSSRSPNGEYHAFAITAPGLEPVAFDELQTLGAADASITDGGVTFSATRRSLYEANLQLRTVSRVVVRVAEFPAKAFHELERRARKVPWEAFISPNLAVSLRVTCRKSRLYHSDAVAERVAGAIASRVSGVRLLGSEDGVRSVDLTPSAFDEEPNQLVLVRLFHDRCTISVDSSGELLHLRGYRQAVGKAPLRETLAAAALLAGGWRGQTPLLDPMCGAGTVPIEGAMIARRIAPGLRRHFAFESWPDFDATGWRTVLERAESKVLDRSPVLIQGSDRDAGAVDSAKANAERAGVLHDIVLSTRAISAIEPPDEPGWIVSNPPYGVRVGHADRLRDLYAQIGNTIRAKCPGWRVVLVSADPSLERQLRLGAKPLLKTTNGGIGVRLIAAQVPLQPDRPIPGRHTTDKSAAQRYPS